MLTILRTSRITLRGQARSSESNQLTHQPSRTFLNFFDKEDSSEKKSTKKASHVSPSLFEKATQSFKEALSNTLNDQMESERDHVMKIVKKKEELAITSFTLGQYQKALENYKGILLLLREFSEENDPKLAHYLHKIGDIYFEVHEWDQAINHYEQSLEILVDGLGEKDDKVARGYFLIGMCNIKQKNYAEAITNYKKALEIYLEDENTGNQNAIASCYSMLAESYLYFGRHEEVYDCTQSLLRILRRMYKDEELEEENDPLMNQYYLNLGTSLAYSTQDYAQATKYLAYYLKSQVHINGERSLGAAGCYLKMGQIKALEGQDQEAIQLVERTLEITRRIAGNQHKLVGSGYNALGTIYLQQKDYKGALEYFQKAKKFFEEETGLERIICQQNIAVALYEQGSYEAAIDNFELAVTERVQFFEGLEETDLQTGILYSYIMACYHHKKDYHGAMEYYAKALGTRLLWSSEGI